MVATLLLAAGYVSGSVPFSYLVARHRGVDIRQVGTHSASPGNVWRNLGPVAGMVALVAELAKGAGPMLLAKALTGDDLVVLLVGLATMVGHNWPLFLSFDGGRGVTLGLLTLLLTSYQWCTLTAAPLLGLTIALRDSAPAVLVAFLLAPAFGLLLGFPLALVLASLGIPAITILRRLTAPCPSEGAPPKRWQELISRLIFDRVEIKCR